ncbi:hypothetical protein E4T56_gene12299 [Termitomyces sp. T112]|nr:hypothetical protein E4T56_gene12299 [Termitomyces sp. T112]
MPSRAWLVFRFARKVVFALITILSIAWVIIFMILLLHEWHVYSVGQRVVVIISLATNAVSAIFSYLMIVVMFRLLQDAMRVVFFLMLQLGSTVTFTVSSPNLPCVNLGSELNCRHVTSVVIYGSWVLIGLLLLYSFSLGVMSYSPPPAPPPPPDPEAALFNTKQAYSPSPSAYSKPFRSNIEQRRSDDSVDSHGSFVQPLSANLSVYRSPLNPSIRSIFASSRGREAYSRPSAMYSALSSNSTICGSKNNLPLYIPRTPVQGMNTSESLPNPFDDPISRFPSPSSVAAFELHLPLQLPPPVLYSPYENNGGQVQPFSLAHSYSRHPNASTAPLDATGNPLSSGPWANVGIPVSLRPTLQPTSPPRNVASPWNRISSFYGC